MLRMELSRRKLLAAAGISVVAASLVPTGEAEAALAVRSSSNPAAPPVHGLHLQFGADASTEMVVSWHTLQSVRRPRVVLGHLDGKLERTVNAGVTTYVDAKSNTTVYAYHAKLVALQPGSAYLYVAMHDGAEPEFGTFRTSPRGRAPFTFTSFGDQGTPTLGKKIRTAAGRDARESTVRQRQPRLAGRRRHDARRRAAAAAVPPVQRRSLLRQPRRRPRAHLVGFLGRTTAAARATVRGCPRPATTRTNSATGRSAIRPTRPTSRCRRRRPDRA